MALSIVVAPVGDNWTVRSSVLNQDLIFPQGGRAENAARALAERYAADGLSAEVTVYLRDGAIAGRLLHPASPTRLMAAE
jgi:hypothetical protein